MVTGRGRNAPPTPAPDDGPRPDLTPTRRSTEDRILIHLARASVDASLTQKELSGALGIRNADVTGACSGLLDKGLLAAVKDGRRQGMALTDEGRIEGDRLIEGLTDKVQTRTVPDSGNRSRGLGTVPTVPVPLIGGEPGTVGGHAKGVGDMAEVVDGPWGADAPTVDDVQALAGAVKLEDWVGALPADVTKWTAADVERFRWAQRVQSGAPEGRRVDGLRGLGAVGIGEERGLEVGLQPLRLRRQGGQLAGLFVGALGSVDVDAVFP